MSARLPIDHRPLGGRALRHQLLQPRTAMAIDHYLSPSPWQPGPRRGEARSPGGRGMKSGGGARLGEAGRSVGGCRGCEEESRASTRPARDFFLKSRPQLPGPSPVPAPGIATARWPRPALREDSALRPKPLATAATAETNAKFQRPNLWPWTPPCIPRAESGPGPSRGLINDRQKRGAGRGRFRSVKLVNC